MTRSALEHLPEIDNGLLRFLTCGSVDDGKSTLIGRLLFDTKTILADTLNAIEKTSAKRGMSAVDLSLLTDGLQAEREQGITIDVAYRYFSTGRRKYIIADAPGHEQYTRNMVTAASTANLAIILVDARKGILTQTRRHSYLASLVGIPHLLVAVNKMDLVGYDQAVFERIKAEYLAFATQLGIKDVRFIPISALAGDMIVDRGEHLPWYEGPTLLDILENAPAANLAIILVDARKGILTQTRRHSYLASLVGIPHLLVAVNKMDLVGYEQAVFARIKAEYLAFATQLGIKDVRFIPISALAGDMIVDRGEHLPWYDGPTLLDILESAPAAHTEQAEDFRFPVQYVCRPHDSANPELHDYRGFMGRVESGAIAVGDAITVLPSGARSRIRKIELGDQSLPRAIHEQSVTLLLDDEIDISRGDLIVKSSEAPVPVKHIDAMICWLSETPLSPARTYLVRHTTREVKAKLARVDYRLDVNTLEREAADGLAMNDIARVTLKLAQPIVADPYRANRATGAFIIIDESTNNTVGAGMVT